MVEIIGNAPDWATFAKAAAATGLTDADGVPLTGAPIASGGSWFYNAVGSVAIAPAVYDFTTSPPTLTTAAVMAPGVWARVRINGDATQMLAMLPVWAANGITVYQQALIGGSLQWSSDGVTAAPDYVADVGVIA